MHATRNDVDEAFLNQYEVDRRSVFVGGLSPHVTEDELMKLFADIGPILDIQLVKKPTAGMSKHSEEYFLARLNPVADYFVSATRVFAFIEFRQPTMPELAVQKFVSISYNMCVSLQLTIL